MVTGRRPAMFCGYRNESDPVGALSWERSGHLRGATPRPAGSQGSGEWRPAQSGRITEFRLRQGEKGVVVALDENVVRRMTNGVVGETTPLRPGEEIGRVSAWQHFTEPIKEPKDKWKEDAARIGRRSVRDHELGTVAGKYDETVRRARHLDSTLDQTTLLAGLLVLRQLRDKLLLDERRLIQAARHQGVTWARIGTALELKSRQAAERRYLQLRDDLDDVAHDRLTQAERVDVARNRRHRVAEYGWATSNGPRIIHVALQLSSITDLQQRADRSVEARAARKRAVNDATFRGAPEPEPVLTPWPGRLRELVTAYQAHEHASTERATPPLRSAGSLLPPAALNKLLHELFGLIGNAADPVVASDHPDLALQARTLYEEAGLAAPRPLPA
ncbi:hypothetical protein ACFRFJ_21215 [Streptomyces hydrogenans]|uniref:hypothetical protein n=1 Tax=Streptomyces hydrogenans TaxID=1873719 RepID=UPI0036A8E84B